MAGIGFELRKVFKNKTIFNFVKGFTSAAFIASGPMIISILMIVFIDRILKSENISMLDRDTIKSSIMYAYVFSMITASGFIMVISRYISDKLYVKNTNDIFASLIGIISVVLLISGIVSGIFYFKSPLPFILKFLSNLLFIELSILYILTAYISAVKDFTRVALAFVIGAIITILISYLTLYFKINLIYGTLLSVIIGYFFNIIIQTYTIKEYFSYLSKEVFSFLTYFKEHYMLFLTNFFYTMGMFIHNIIFWKFSTLRQNIMNTYFYAPAYDTASFFAILTTIPASIIFVVRFETTFYEKYKTFCDCIEYGGSLRDLLSYKKRMLDTLKRELMFIMEIQLIMTIILTVIGVYVIMPIFANDPKAIELYVFLSIGYFMSYMTFIIIIVLTYFDIRKPTFIISTVFLILTIFFTFISIYLGESYYGLGYDISSLITLIISLNFLNSEMKHIDYRLYSR